MEVPFRHATPENEWRELFWRHIPSWLSVSDRNILDEYYKGDSTLYIDKHINSWLMPCLWWSAFVVVLVFVMICINVIVRRAWVENEKLSYPIIQLPLEMTDSTLAIFKNKGLWLGVGISERRGNADSRLLRRLLTLGLSTSNLRYPKNPLIQ